MLVIQKQRLQLHKINFYHGSSQTLFTLSHMRIVQLYSIVCMSKVVMLCLRAPPSQAVIAKLCITQLNSFFVMNAHLNTAKTNMQSQAYFTTSYTGHPL